MNAFYKIPESMPAVNMDSLISAKKVLISSIVTCETFLCLHRVRDKRKAVSSVPGAGDDADKKKRQTRGGKAAGKKKKEVVKRITVSRAPRGKKKFVTVVTGLTSYGEWFFPSRQLPSLDFSITNCTRYLLLSIAPALIRLRHCVCIWKDITLLQFYNLLL